MNSRILAVPRISLLAAGSIVFLLLSLDVLGQPRPQDPRPMPTNPQDVSRPRQDSTIVIPNNEAEANTTVREERAPRIYVSRSVRCPPYVLEVTSRIPDGWYPAFSSMTYRRPARIEIGEVRGYGVRLICYYDGSRERSIDQLFQTHGPIPTDMPVCVTSRKTFRCRPRGPYIFWRGNITVVPASEIELDTNATLDPRNSRDFNWVVFDSRLQFLESRSPGAKIRRISHRATPETCAQALAGQTPRQYSGELLNPGAVFCFRTISKRFGTFTVRRAEGRTLKTLTLAVTTWPKDTD